VALVFCALIDPPAKKLFLFRLEGFVGFRRRHGVVRVGGEEAFDKLAFVRLARNDGHRTALRLRRGVLREVQAEPGLSRRGVGTVTAKAVFREHRPDVAIKAQVCRCCRGAKQQGQGTDSREETEHERHTLGGMQYIREGLNGRVGRMEI
jgi:hypothetical protein